MAVSQGTFGDLQPGETFTTPSRTIEAADAEAMIRTGGYTHPLFTDPDYAAASPFGRTPLPGEAVLLMMGGLVEQTDRFDDTTIALIGFEDVRFAAPAFPGDTISVEVTVAAKEERGRRGSVVFGWRCHNDRGETLVEARARMLFRTDGGTP